MADKSVRKAQSQWTQSPLLCQLCDNQTIKWKCHDCGIFMCTKCQGKVHPRFESAVNHRIVSIQDIGKEGEQDQSAPKEVLSEVVSSVFNTYTPNVHSVGRLLCCDDIIYYLCNKVEPKLVKAKLLKASIRVLQTVDIKCFDMTFDKDGDILCNNFEDLKLHVILSSGKDKTVLDMSPFIPLALHLNKDNELIVGLREEGPLWPVRDFSVRQVVVLGTDYKRKNTLERDGKGERLFSYAAIITTDSKNNIYVVDWQNEDNIGRILAVDRYGHAQFSYSGQSEFEFVPEGITATPSDNIVVTDYRNNALHMLHALNSRGDLLALQDVAKISIMHPVSLCIDNEGFLIIGCWSSNKDAKIHVVKLSQSLM